ncbi:hypothetical protein LCM27_11910 [Ruegeria marisrubri]|uniref:hypothetical protein n=1 Tax=Ruegeria marisrubri TaxID=1685379 RepID=UPI001CD2B98D|nr:hypothetical protein [Ruegeria marisrubri]MCA0907098.1 hypothetical protein [Ruegeria marisrubri]
MEGIVSDTEQISLLVSAGSMLSLVVLLFALSGKTEFDYFGAKLPIRFFPQIAILPTLVHFFLFLRLKEKISSYDPIPDIAAWEKITSEGGWVFNGMQKRLPTDDTILSLNVVTFSANDFAFVASLVFAILLFAALTVSLFPHLIDTVGSFFQQPHVLDLKKLQIPTTKVLAESLLKMFVAVSLPIVNWIIGTGWALEISSLSP